MMIEYQCVTALHGNEPLPTLALASIGVEQVVGNPRALSKGVRFSEQDLNGSFGCDGGSYEEGRAREMLLLLDGRLVIDFHTFSAKSPPFVIIVEMEMLPLAQSLGLEHIVYMKHNIKSGQALIDHIPGVSVEVGQHDDPASFELTLELVDRLKNPKPASQQKLYEVCAIINKPGDYKNFQPSSGGFYPVLAGENAYAHYGLQTQLKEEL